MSSSSPALPDDAEALRAWLELAATDAALGRWALDALTSSVRCDAAARALLGLDGGAADAASTPLADLLAGLPAADAAVFEAGLAAGQGSLQTTWAGRADAGAAPPRRRALLLRWCTRAGPDAGPRVLGTVAPADLAQRQAAERALRHSQERAELATRGAGIGTWEMDLGHHQAFWDEQMWRLRGLVPQAEPMPSASALACLHPDDRERSRLIVTEAMRSGTPLDYEFRVVWPDGRVRWLASRSVEQRDETGLRRRIGVNWDVTASRAAEAAERELALAQRESQAKSRFLARMSHELRTPLNAVLGFTQLLLADEGDRAQRRQRLELVHDAGRHLLALIDDVLDLARVEGGEPRLALQPVLLESLVADALASVQAAARARGVALHARRLALRVQADAVRLRQVLLNLLDNAIKFNHEGGHVTVEAQRDGAQVLLRVIDTGRGLSRAQLQHLFEPFNRLGVERDAIEGTGIGLAVVKALVQTLGGRIEVASEVGAGSVFAVRLAASDAAAASAPAEAPDPGRGASADAASAADVPRPAPRPRLLYVEDNPTNALIIRELVERRGDLEFAVAADGRSGVAHARALQPALVLLDMQLPDFDGLEVLRRLRADPATAAIPVVALSANAMPEAIRRALDAGIADYWTKPLDFDAFDACLDRLFGRPA